MESEETPENTIKIDLHTYIVSDDEAAELLVKAAKFGRALDILGITPSTIVANLPALIALSTDNADAMKDTIKNLSDFAANNAEKFHEVLRARFEPADDGDQ